MLSREELKEGLKEMGHPDPSDATVSAMLEAAEMGNEQEINLEDFKILWKNKDDSWDWGAAAVGWLASIGSLIDSAVAAPGPTQGDAAAPPAAV
jgi:hypothetical protein